MKDREGKKDINYSVMVGPTSERVNPSVHKASFAQHQKSYQAIKTKNLGQRTKTLLNADETMKENLSMDLINDLFGESKKRQQNALNRNLTSATMQSRVQQKSDNPSQVTSVSRTGDVHQRIR